MKYLFIVIILIGGFIYGANRIPDRRRVLEIDVQKNTTIKREQEDRLRASLERSHRVQKIKEFLESKGSPLAPYSDLLVSMGESYSIDPRLIVGISAIESTYCLNGHAYNCFGLGGTNFIHFSSYPEGIEYVFKLLATSGYYRTWRKTGSLVELARTYCTSEAPEKYATFLQNIIDKI